MRPRIVLVVALTLALVAVLGGVAYAQTLTTNYTTTAECYTCHRGTGPAVSKVDFAVPAVDYNKCATCHGAIEHNATTPQHWHNLYSRCSSCHGIMLPSILDTSRFFQGYTLTQYGRFSWPESLTASPQALHAAHSGNGWVNSLSWSRSSACQPCHQPAACSACHGTVQHGTHSSSQYTPVTYLQATGTSAVTTPSSCINGACHDRAKVGTAAFKPACSSCHPTRMTYHGYGTGNHLAADSTVSGIACSSCHSLELATVHLDPTASGTSCAKCHPQPRQSLGVWNRSCVGGGCHTATSTRPMHAGTSTKHAVSAANARCLDCHAGTELGSVHAAAKSKTIPGATSCLVCHSASKVPVTGDCTVCHFTFAAHYNVAKHQSVSITCGGSGCHDTPGLVAVHQQRNAAFDCRGCHNSVRSEVQNAIVNHLTGCGDCHGSISALGGHRSAHAAVPPLANVDGTPNYSYSAGSTGTAPTRDCAGCHTSNLVDEHLGVQLTGAWVIFPRRDSSGAALTCGTCHDQPAGSTVQAAIAARASACEKCHTVHRPIATTHTSTFVDAPAMACADCHSADLSVEHNGTYVSTAKLSGCDVCHALYTGTSGAVSAASVQAAISVANDTRCSACHGTYHGDMTVKHTNTTMTADCTQAGCHSASLPTEHDKYLSRYPAYASSCTLCHKNANPARVNWATATADCASCHTLHADITTIHTATASAGCTACHETGDVRQLHGTSAAASCAVCHNAPAGRINWTTATIECASCHGGYSQIDPNHYPVAAHNASAETACGQCHYTDMKSEHFLSTVSPAVTCVSCHELKVDTFTAAWGKTCITCHAVKHADQGVKHVSAAAGCGGTGCHVLTDVAAIHGKPTGPGCAACHVSPSVRATTTNCTNSGCHANIGPNHHEAHNSALVNPSECQSCHMMYLDDEHAALGFTCATCHDSVVATVAGAIAAKDLRCMTCHPAAHSALQFEFNPLRASVHRVSSDLPGMRSTFYVGGTKYTWTLPSANSFLKTGWTTDSMMSCADCHSYSDATGPHGASMKVNLDPAYPNSIAITAGSTRIAQLSKSSPTGMSMSKGGSAVAGVICEKCHDLNGSGSSFSNNVHNEHDDRGSEGGYCNYCHGSLPHGWSRPRLIGYTTDSAPYNTYRGGVQRISLKSYTPSGWDKADCGAACSSDRHPLSGTSWPAADAVVPTTGSITGTVKTSTGSAITGATVTVGTKTATSTSSGYSITDVTAGTYTMTVAASGYVSWSGTVTIVAGEAASQSVTLAAIRYGNVSGTVKNASGAAVSGATVNIDGKSATTSSSGTYSITGVVTGAYTMTVSATGYNSWSGPVTISANTTVTQNVTLTPIVQYGNASGTVKNASGAAVSGATVNIDGKSATTSSSGTYSITGVVTGAYTMTVSATGYNSWSGPVTISANTTVTQNVTLTPLPTNIARTGTASASSTDGYSYAASKAIDGDINSYWRSSSGSTQWLRVDLGSAKTLTSVIVNWNGSYYARSYRVETSADGSNWTQRYSTSSGNGSVDTITLSSVSARYVRIYCTSGNYSDYRVNEFEVWGY